MLGWRVVCIFFWMTLSGSTTVSWFLPKPQSYVFFDLEQPSTYANPSTILEKEDKGNLSPQPVDLNPGGYLDSDYSENEKWSSTSTSSKAFPVFHQEENITPQIQEQTLHNKSSLDVDPHPSLFPEYVPHHHVDPAYYFQYNNQDSRREENADSYGSVFGSYSYTTGGGNDILVEYRAGPNMGFVIDNWDQLQDAVKRATEEGLKQETEMKTSTATLDVENQNNYSELGQKVVKNLLVQDEERSGLVIENQLNNLQQSESYAAQYVTDGQVFNGEMNQIDNVFMGNSHNPSDVNSIQGDNTGEQREDELSWAELESTTRKIEPFNTSKQPQLSISTQNTAFPIIQAEEVRKEIKEKGNSEISNNLPVIFQNDNPLQIDSLDKKLVYPHDNKGISVTIDVPNFAQPSFPHGSVQSNSTNDPQQTVADKHSVKKVPGAPIKDYSVSPLSVLLNPGSDPKQAGSKRRHDSVEISSLQLYDGQRPSLEWSRPGYQGGSYSYLDQGTGQTVIFRQEDGRDGYMIFGPDKD